MTLSLYFANGIHSAVKDFSRSDGYTWRDYHEYVKIGFALGFLAGANKAVEELDPVIRQSYYEKKEVKELLPIYNITNTQLKQRLDEFYASSTNLSIPIQDAIIIICKEMVPIKDKKMIEREKEVAKLPPAKQKVERIKDHLKAEIKKGYYPKYEVEKEQVVAKETKEPVPLKTEKEVTHFWYDLMVPEEARVKEVVKVNYALVASVTAASIIIIGVLIFLLAKAKKKR